MERHQTGTSESDRSLCGAIPVALFAYCRTDCLEQTLRCLRENNVPKIYAFSDAPRIPAHAAGVKEVREMLRGVDWCDIVITERRTNLGLGKSLVLGITETLDKHDTLLVFEDDHVIVPGAYAWMCAALEHYRDMPNVMSVTGWTHPRITPKDIGSQPYLDGRAECWVWGTWRRAWQGMESTDAMTLLKECKARDIWPRKYGDDLPEMAANEQAKNVWAVRWIYWHMLHGGLCVRPPHSMVEHIGVAEGATNVGSDNSGWQHSQLQPCPPIPTAWPAPVEHPDCVKLWRKACKASEEPKANGPAATAHATTATTKATPPTGLREKVLQWLGGAPATSAPSSKAPEAPAEPQGPVTFTGKYKDWQSASAACGDGYGDDDVIGRVRAAALKVKRGEARYERDGMTFDDDFLPWEALAGLLRASAMQRGTLRVLDFGGSLGSSYYQCREFLKCAGLQRWVVVEQPKFVEVGSADFADDVLRFSGDPVAAFREHAPTVLLVSGVLQYLEKPHDMLRTLAGLGIPHIIVDRTAFWENAEREDQLTIQTVAPEIYPAKYPAWFFQESAFLTDLLDAYTLISRFDSWETWRVDNKKRARNRGFILDLKRSPA